MTETIQKNKLNKFEPDETFVRVLKDNPDLFQRHPELLELVHLTDSRGTASLLEKQVATLQQRLKNMRLQQSDFFAVLKENEQINDRFSNIIFKLIGFQNLSEFAAEFPSALRTTFKIDEVSFKTPAAVQNKEVELANYQAALERLPNGEAMCDNRWPKAVLDLFFSSKVKSAALVPMKHSGGDEIIGILALGAFDPARYTHELGTAHLSNLGQMAGICLHRLQPAT